MRNRIQRLRRFGKWQWDERREAHVLAWLLDLPPEEAAAVVARFDAADARTSSKESRRRNLRDIRGALRFAAEREGRPVPKIAPAVKDAA